MYPTPQTHSRPKFSAFSSLEINHKFIISPAKALIKDVGAPMFINKLERTQRVHWSNFWRDKASKH